MALDIKIGIKNTKTQIMIFDETGDYNAITNDTGWFSTTPKTFVGGNISTANDTVTINNHGFYTGQRVIYSFTGQGMAPVANGVILYVIAVDANTLKFSQSATLLPILDLDNISVSNNALTAYDQTRARVSAISLTITPPTNVALSPINLYSTTFWTSEDRALDLTGAVTLADGIWKYETTFTYDGSPMVETNYVLRTNDLLCRIGKLALGNMTSNDYAEIKLMYDNMVNAYDCAEYTLAQEIYANIDEALTDCNIPSCSC